MILVAIIVGCAATISPLHRRPSDSTRGQWPVRGRGGRAGIRPRGWPTGAWRGRRDRPARAYAMPARPVHRAAPTLSVDTAAGRAGTPVTPVSREPTAKDWDYRVNWPAAASRQQAVS